MESEEFDLFISYAKEDESLAKTFLNMPLRIFFAPQQLLADDPNAQARLIAALKQSRGILLLWSQWVDKSEWVALETAVFATDRSVQRGKHQTHLAVLDLGGPLVPPWLPYDLILQPASPADLAKIFNTNEWWRSITKPQQPAGPLSLADEVLFRLSAWNTRVRGVLLRVGPEFSISHLRTEDLRSLAVARLIRNALGASMLWIVAIAGISLALWAWGLHFPHDWQGYVPRAIMIVAGVAYSAALVLSLRVGVAAGLAAGIVGAAFGCATAIIAAFFRRPDPLAGAVAAGSVLGAAAAIALSTHQFSKREDSPRRLDWRPVAGILFSLSLVVLGQAIAQSWAISNSSPPASMRAIFAASLGAFIFAPIAAITGWFAHLQIRFRHWLQAFSIGVFIWLCLIVVTAAVAAYVPFGNPYDLRDGIGVGLLSGAVAASLLTIIAYFLRRLAGDAASVPWAVAVLLAIGLPVLKLFPHIQAASIYTSVCLSAPLVFCTVLWNCRRRGIP